MANARNGKMLEEKKVKNSDLCAIAIVAVLFIVLCALSLGLTMAIMYGVCLCFDWTYSHKMAIGIWLIMILAKNILTVKVDSK